MVTSGKNMKSLFLKLFFLLIFSFFIVSCDSEKQWHGRYSYTASFGENVAGTPVIVNFDLKISSEECFISINGYQTEEEIICDIENGGKNKINILFKSYKDGSLTGFYAVQLYQVKELLFSLSFDNNELITEWGSLIIENPFPKKGVYFERNGTEL